MKQRIIDEIEPRESLRGSSAFCDKEAGDSTDHTIACSVYHVPSDHLVRHMEAVTLVGHSTLGSLLGSERFDLPGGWVLTVPTHASWSPDGKRYIDRSVTPDVEVTWTRAGAVRGA